MDLNNSLLTLEMESADLYEIFLHEITKKIDEGKNEEILKKVKFGIDIKFDFEFVIKQRFKEKIFVKTRHRREVGENIVKIKVGPKEITKTKFEDEIFQRVRLMRGWLWENMTIEKVGGLRENKTQEGKDGE